MEKTNNYLFAAIFFIVLGTFTIVAITFHFVFAGHKYAEYGTLGDAIGGITNPIIAIGAAILTFAAFYIQYIANKQVQDQFKVQQFESQFYEMLRLHRANIDEMEIGSSVNRRKSFVRMFYEYKFIYLKLYEIYLNNNVYQKHLNKLDLCKITYYIFFFGIGLNSEKIIFNLIEDKYERITKELVERLKIIKDDYVINAELFINDEKGENFQFKMIYKPFDGHNSRLGHYYRHLYQTVSFVVNSNVIINRDEQYNYLKLLRAQLSNHEQLLLYYNSLTKFGQGWIDNGYFTNYKMIKNIPLEFADFGEKPKDFLKDKNDFGERIFEWDELKN